MKKLTRPQLQQLLSYVKWAEIDGCYYGPKDSFDKRHLVIKEWIRQQLNEATKTQS
jgi:hypothetical protein